MDLRIADSFTESLGRLSGDEQKAVKTSAFDLQLNPASPGFRFHRLDKARDKRFWSVRVGSDIRLIVHRSENSLLLCYVDHHDKAYEWAERRKLETHPTTGAAQFVEIRETVKEITVPVYVPARPSAAPRAAESLPLFAQTNDEELLRYGVPPEWLPDVKSATEASLLGLTDHLPAEAAEALLELATGGAPRPVDPSPATASPFEHPDAQRRFRTVANVQELERALESPWDKWIVFLHPDQRFGVERDYSGPARVAGTAGTGKTIVALHRAAHLTRTNPDARTLLTTISEPLAFALHSRLKRLIGNEPRLGERLDVYALDAIGERLYRSLVGPLNLIPRRSVSTLVQDSASAVGGHKFSPHFLLTEWEQVVDAWQLEDWSAYRDVARLGRKTRLPEAQRGVLWSIFERVRLSLQTQQQVTHAAMFTALAKEIRSRGRSPYDYAVVDESQDLTVAQLRFLAALGGGRPNALLFAGDLGQRIFQQPFSWKALGVDIRGRSKTLRVNYRTSHQIRSHADRLLNAAVTDVDGNIEERRDTVSVFNGPAPAVLSFKTQAEEQKAVGEWLVARVAEGIPSHQLAVFVRSDEQVERAMSAVREAALSCKVLDDHVETTTGQVAVGTMHLAKGLEFRAVAVMACDDEVIPLQERIEMVGDDADLQEVYDTERQLLYVASTRARDHLIVTSVEPASEFLDDLRRTPGVLS